MNPAPNPFKNRILRAPKGMEEECGSLEVLHTARCFISAWEPTEEDIAAILRGEKVWLTVFCNVQPPVAITTGDRPPEEFME